MDMERRRAEVEVTATTGGTAAPEAVLDRLTERLAARLGTQLCEGSGSREAGGGGASSDAAPCGSISTQVEAYCNEQVAQHTCPICYELMSGVQHRPTLLFPCGERCVACMGAAAAASRARKARARARARDSDL